MSKPVFEDLFSFTGRRNRKSYILFQLALGCLFLAAVVVLLAANASMHRGLLGMALGVCGVLLVAAIVSNLAVTSQRCRDFGWTGWAQLLAFVPYLGVLFPFALMVVPGTLGDNRYGPDPLDMLRYVPPQRHARSREFA
jgi:uncharacterized membrane protein YhaH (DUF805 family)